ncbi:MAG: barstar family protein [Pseudomonadota bacterium]
MTGIFNQDDWKDRVDWPLFQNGAISLFFRKSIFDQTIGALKDLDYNFVDLDCSSEASFLSTISRGFLWEEQFGYELEEPNLDAINDGLRSPPFGPSNKLAICARDFEKMVKANETLALAFLDILENQSRNNLLFGQVLLGIIQTNDPRFQTGLLGGRPAMFNLKEWLDVNRGIEQS